MIRLALRQLAWEARHSATAVFGLAIAFILTVHIVLPGGARLIEELLS